MTRILLPVDNNKTRANQVVDTVENLFAEHEDIKVTVLNVFEEFDVDGGVVRSSDLYDEEEIPDSVDLVLERLESIGIPTELHHKHGDPTQEILNVADDINADLIMMGGRKRTPAGKVLFGSVIQKVLLSAKQPVITTIA